MGCMPSCLQRRVVGWAAAAVAFVLVLSYRRAGIANPDPAKEAAPSAPAEDEMPNAVFVLHEDGTIGEYRHFKKDGVVVTKGDEVRTGPHLHFNVVKREGSSRVSVRVRFRTTKSESTWLAAGARYRNPDAPGLTMFAQDAANERISPESRDNEGNDDSEARKEAETE